MKKLFANLAIAFGLVVTALGLVGTPVLQDLLPVEFMLFFAGDQSTHRYFRVVEAPGDGASFLRYALLFAGLLLFVTGVAFRRKLRRNAA
jgi:hypothetical protein